MMECVFITSRCDRRCNTSLVSRCKRQFAAHSQSSSVNNYKSKHTVRRVPRYQRITLPWSFVMKTLRIKYSFQCLEAKLCKNVDQVNFCAEKVNWVAIHIVGTRIGQSLFQSFRIYKLNISDIFVRLQFQYYVSDISTPER